MKIISHAKLTKGYEHWKQAFDENESNAKERSATRELATRIPILGGNRKFRETVVDGIAGESSTKSNGWSSSWGSEWK